MVVFQKLYKIAYFLEYRPKNIFIRTKIKLTALSFLLVFG